MVTGRGGGGASNWKISMSDAYENVVGGRLKLKGKALDVKAASGGIIKKKKKTKPSYSSDQTKRRADNNDLSAASGKCHLSISVSNC